MNMLDVMTDDEFDEEDCGAAAQVIEIILLNCRGMVDHILPHSIELALKKFNSSQDNSNNTNFKIQLLDVIINSLYYNPKLCLSFLNSKVWLQNFFNIWFSIYPEFERLHDIKLSILALSSIYLVPSFELPPSVQSEFKTITSHILKLIYQYTETKKIKEVISSDSFDDNHILKQINITPFSDDKDVDIFQLKNGFEENDEYKLTEDSEFVTVISTLDEMLSFLNAFENFSKREPQLFNDMISSLSEIERTQLEDIRNEGMKRLSLNN